mgnify:CR=1 FL=1
MAINKPKTRVLLHFDGNVVDSSGNGVAFTAGSVNYVSGKFGQCSSIATAPSQHAINTTGEFAKIHNLLGDYTIDFWLDFDSFNAQYQGIGMYFGRTASYTSILGMAISRGSYGAFSLEVFYQAGATIVTSSVTSTFGWKHVCIQKTNGNIYLYLNGVLLGSNTFPNANATFSPSTNTDLIVGEQGNSGHSTKIDEFRIIEGVAFNLSGFTPPTQAY